MRKPMSQTQKDHRRKTTAAYPPKDNRRLPWANGGVAE
jgi:hypothetical protein